MASPSSTGVSTRAASLLAYLGWWITGLLFWALERQDERVRFHAAQSTIVFGLFTIIIGALVAGALLTLSFAPDAFTLLLSAACALSIVAKVVWVVAMWKGWREEDLRIPVVARLADAAIREPWSAIRKIDSGSRRADSGMRIAEGGSRSADRGVPTAN
jgi:uncharacterized membrane protein